MTPWAELERENSRTRPFFLKGFLIFSDRKNIWLWAAAQPMHQYEVTEVNCPFRCFPLCVRCINTRAITLYGHILFHSRLSHLHASPHFINPDQFQQTWQQKKDWKSERMHTNTKFVTTCVQWDQTVPSYAVEVQLFTTSTKLRIKRGRREPLKKMFMNSRCSSWKL